MDEPTRQMCIDTIITAMSEWGFLDVLADALASDPETTIDDQVHLTLLTDALALLSGRGVETTWFKYLMTFYQGN